MTIPVTSGLPLDKSEAAALFMSIVKIPRAAGGGCVGDHSPDDSDDEESSFL